MAIAASFTEPTVGQERSGFDAFDKFVRQGDVDALRCAGDRVPMRGVADGGHRHFPGRAGMGLTQIIRAGRQFHERAKCRRGGLLQPWPPQVLRAGGRRVQRRAKSGEQSVVGHRPSGAGAVRRIDALSEIERLISGVEAGKRQGARRPNFGDGWEHKIKIARLDDPIPGVLYPRLPEAKWRCLREDLGGSWGYAEFWEALKDPE